MTIGHGCWTCGLCGKEIDILQGAERAMSRQILLQYRSSQATLCLCQRNGFVTPPRPVKRQGKCGRGGTGRRAALRSLWGKTRGSSSLLDRTKISLLPDGSGDFCFLGSKFLPFAAILGTPKPLWKSHLGPGCLEKNPLMLQAAKARFLIFQVNTKA